MIVRCISSSGKMLPPSALDASAGVTAETEFEVSPGQLYPVHAIATNRGIAWYYVPDDVDLPWPTWAPASLFEIVDGSLPESWIAGYFRWPDEERLFISFPEWASDHYFYERLVDGDPETVRIYARRTAEVPFP